MAKKRAKRSASRKIKSAARSPSDPSVWFKPDAINWTESQVDKLLNEVEAAASTIAASNVNPKKPRGERARYILSRITFIREAIDRGDILNAVLNSMLLGSEWSRLEHDDLKAMAARQGKVPKTEKRYDKIRAEADRLKADNRRLAKTAIVTKLMKAGFGARGTVFAALDGWPAVQD